MPQHMNMPDGGVLHYNIKGVGAPLVLVHGFSLDHRQWESQVAGLSQHFTCITYDMRGFGGSSVATQPYDHVEDLKVLLDHLSVAHPHLVGLSLGGLVAHVFAARYASRPASLTLVSSGSRGHSWKEQRPVDAAHAYAREHSAAETKRFWMDLPLFESLNDYPKAKTAVEAIVADYSGWHFMNTDPQAEYPDTPGPQDIKVPTLVMRGARDVAGYYEISATLADTIPGARLVTYETCGHMLPMEDPERFNRDLHDFIASTDSGHRIGTKA